MVILEDIIQIRLKKYEQAKKSKLSFGNLKGLCNFLMEHLIHKSYAKVVHLSTWSQL